jgi:hypothetical protein
MSEIEEIKRLAGINETSREDAFWEMRANLAAAVRSAVQALGPVNEVSRKINDTLMAVDEYAKENFQTRRPPNIRS